jgi:hypothetical protein
VSTGRPRWQRRLRSRAQANAVAEALGNVSVGPSLVDVECCLDAVRCPEQFFALSA